MVREFKRNGADTVLMSSVQWEGYFGGFPGESPKIDGLTARVVTNLPEDEIWLTQAGVVVGVVKRLYVRPHEEEL